MERWAIILGASSGFGAASARVLALQGYNICGVHFDSRSTRGRADAVREIVEATGRDTLFINRNAADPRTRQTTLEALATRLHSGMGGKKGQVALLLHSLAFGSLRPFVATNVAADAANAADAPDAPDAPETSLDAAAMTMTLDVMAHSLVYWVQDLVARDLFAVPGGRVLALTSAGSAIAWPAYGAVSAAKAALEAHCRQLALELAPRGVTVNAISAGVCDTPALRKIPGWRRLLADAGAKNPSGRVTRPDDVAAVVSLLARPEAAWITGSVIRVDGGEGIAGLAGPSEAAAPTGSDDGDSSDSSDDGDGSDDSDDGDDSVRGAEGDAAKG